MNREFLEELENRVQIGIINNCHKMASKSIDKLFSSMNFDEFDLDVLEIKAYAKASQELRIERESNVN